MQRLFAGSFRLGQSLAQPSGAQKAERGMPVFGRSPAWWAQRVRGIVKDTGLSFTRAAQSVCVNP